MSVTDCTHPVMYQGLCAACGQDVTEIMKKNAQTANAASKSNKSNAHSSSTKAAAALTDSAHTPIVLGGAHKTIHLSSAALLERTRSNTLELLNSRKMLCVLDLDHTLLHATSDPRIGSYLDQEPDLYRFTLGAPPHTRTHYVKLRPHLQTFLEEVSKVFDLHVYTMGARPYADAVVALLDSTHRFIKHRIVSRDETIGNEPGVSANPAHVAKSLKRMYPCDEGLICIVDDRTDVWAGNASNVVRAFEYLYFSGRGDMNSRPDQQDHSGDALPIFNYQMITHPFPDNVLLSLTSVLQAVHSLFYRQIDHATKPLPGESIHAQHASVSDLLPLSNGLSIPRLITLIKRTTLTGCVIVFSGVFPTMKGKDGLPLPGATGAQRQEAWIQATAYGATCLEDFPEREATSTEDEPVIPFGTDICAPRPVLRVTHVVAAREGSAKLHYASTLPADKRPHLVHVSWLWHSLAHFQRGDEKLFPLWSEMKKEKFDESLPTNTNATTTTTATTTATTSKVEPVVNLTASTPAPPTPSNLPITTPSAASTTPSTTTNGSAATTLTVGGIRRRIPKKVAPVAMEVETPAVAASSTTASAPPAKPATSTAASTTSPEQLSRYALHLVHHVKSPPTPAQLIERVLTHLVATESEQTIRNRLADETLAIEKEKAAQLHSRRASGGGGPTTPRAHRKSVTFRENEVMGPTNPNYESEPHTMTDLPTTDQVTHVPSSLKRKAHAPLDDVDRVHKERKLEEAGLHGRRQGAHTPPIRSTTAAPSSMRDEYKDEEDVEYKDEDLNLDDDDDDTSENGITTEELYRQPDALPDGVDGVDPAEDEPDPFAIDDECFNDEADYGDQEQFDDDG